MNQSLSRVDCQDQAQPSSLPTAPLLKCDERCGGQWMSSGVMNAGCQDVKTSMRETALRPWRSCTGGADTGVALLARRLPSPASSAVTFPRHHGGEQASSQHPISPSNSATSSATLPSSYLRSRRHHHRESPLARPLAGRTAERCLIHDLSPPCGFVRLHTPNVCRCPLTPLSMPLSPPPPPRMTLRLPRVPRRPPLSAIAFDAL